MTEDSWVLSQVPTAKISYFLGERCCKDILPALKLFTWDALVVEKNVDISQLGMRERLLLMLPDSEFFLLSNWIYTHTSDYLWVSLAVLLSQSILSHPQQVHDVDLFSGYRCLFPLFKTLLRYDLHLIKCTHSKYRVWRVLTNVYICVTSTTVKI